MAKYGRAKKYIFINLSWQRGYGLLLSSLEQHELPVAHKIFVTLSIRKAGPFVIIVAIKKFLFSLVTDSMAYSIGHVSVCIFYHDKDFKGRRG